MSSRPTRLVLAAVLVATGAAVSLVPRSNAVRQSGGALAESSALYCAGLSSHALGADGIVTVRNIATVSRHVDVTVHSDTGASSTTTLTIAAGATAPVQPAQLAAGSLYGVDLVANGPGLVAVEHTLSGHTTAPCSPAGRPVSVLTGLTTRVGTDTYVSLFNPTATPAVVNVTVYSSSGFAAPNALQGITVPGHVVTVLNLGQYVVNNPNFAVRARVVHGTLIARATVTGNGVPSLVDATAVTRHVVLPVVTTADGAVVSLDFVNPSNRDATVTAAVSLGDFAVPDQSVVVPAYSTASLQLNPNPAIPAAGNAVVTVRSSVAVGMALAVGTTRATAVVAAPAPAPTIYVDDLYAAGFADLVIANPGQSPVTVTATQLGGTERTTVTIAPGAATALGTAGSWSTQVGAALRINATGGPVVVTASWPSSPSGLSLSTGF